MHVLTAVVVAFAVWRFGDWKGWQKYHSTMLYFIFGNVMYLFLTAGYSLWSLKADFASNYIFTELLYMFIVLPGTALLYLSKMPVSTKGRIKHIIKWIVLYAAIEGVYAYATDSIQYDNGWHLGWSLLFDCVMFPMLLLHYKKPLLSYLISFPIAMFLIWYFKVPVHLPIEKRI